MHKNTVLVPITILALFILSCGGLAVQDSPQAVATPTISDTPTRTPTAAPTPSPTPASQAATASPVHAEAGPSRTPARVVEVVDGDTIRVEIDGQVFPVRYIGVDAPEVQHPSKGREPFGPEAAAHNADLVADQTVLLEKDVSETDRYGRLLRYVWLGDLLVNEAMVRDGFAVSSSYPPDIKYQDRFIAAQREAQASGRGLWSASSAAAAASSNALQATFIADLTIPDGAEMQPGQSFEKSWRLQNTGDAPWPADCIVAHVMADNFGAHNFPLGVEVPPGQTTDITIAMTAPTQPGAHESWWQLKSPDGQSIGKAFYVRIRVAGEDASPAIVQPLVPAGQPATVTTPQPPLAAGGCAYIGNASTKKFHRPGCSEIRRMKESNKVCLTSRDEAISLGFIPCKKCEP